MERDEVTEPVVHPVELAVRLTVFRFPDLADTLAGCWPAAQD